MTPMIRPRRSMLFLAGLNPERHQKAMATGADMVCIDLEDAVAPDRKDEARAKTMPLMAATAPEDRVQTVIRVNSLRCRDGLNDMVAILQTPAPPPAILLPKVDSPAEVMWADELLREAKRPVELYALIESNEGLAHAREIAACLNAGSRRLKGLVFGAYDMSAALGARQAWAPLAYARGRVIHAAASAGIDAIDVPWLDLNDDTGMRAEAEAARDMGFAGKAAIHPEQIGAINAIFTPDAATVARAERIMAAFAAEPSGLLVVDGKLIEKPVIRHMERILAIARAAAR
ncbi:MAG: CoA ester lyase [Alphaproteobacteria bacterium]|nr:CoA ester lyase [Alphaproteobacteria bacterium]